MDRNKILSISFDMDLKLICIKYSINNQIYEYMNHEYTLL